MAVYEYRIHPSVGIARMGDSPHVFFIGREAPEHAFTPVPSVIPGQDATKVTGPDSLRDTDGKLLKQGARFRVYCYEYPDYLLYRDALPTHVWECTAADYDIEWAVKVANLKSWDGTGGTPVPNIPNTPAEQKLNTTAPPVTPVKFAAGGRLELGSAFLQATGQLVVLGSNGLARKIPAHAGSAAETDLRWKFWEDDAADGYVRAVVTPKAGSSKKDKGKPAQSARDAWVVINMPNYGLDTPPSPSLYDLALNHAIANSGTGGGWTRPTYYSEPLSYHRNIEAFVRAYSYARFVSPEARNGMSGSHMAGHVVAPVIDPSVPSPLGSHIQRFLRQPWKTKSHKSEDYWTSAPCSRPEYTQAANAQMPNLNYLAFPEIAFQWLKAWATAGAAFPAGSPGWASTVGASAEKRVMLLDIAHMGWMSGGSFYPGIEVGREVHNYKRWKADWGTRKDHVDIRFDPAIGPGEMTQNLAAPWQADFQACNNPWWPMSRPIEVKQAAATYYEWLHDTTGLIPVTGARGLIDNYAKLGFIRYDVASKEYREDSRTLSHP